MITTGTPLNKYLAHAGVGSRRGVVTLIQEGKVRVNGAVISNPAHRVSITDIVQCNAAVVRQETKVYILLNKPKNCVTTAADEQGRRTVLDLIGDRCTARVYPVGRLDRDTTGLVVLTNDGDCAQRLAHPKNEIRKTYHVTLDRLLDPLHEQAMRKGVLLEDGRVKVDKLVILAGSHRRMIAVSLHSGRYHIVRRLFEHFGYQVQHLDRPLYAGLTKHGLKPGAWRYLTKDEVEVLRNGKATEKKISTKTPKTSS